MRQALSVDVSKLPPSCERRRENCIKKAARERRRGDDRLQHDPGAGLRRAAGLRREVAGREHREGDARELRGRRALPLDQEGGRAAAAASRGDRPYLAYAAVAVAAVAAIV